MIHVDNIVLARDFSPVSDQALHYALYLARKADATLHLLYAEVLHEDPFMPSSKERPEEQVRERLLKGRGGMSLPEQVDDLKIETAIVRGVAAAPALLSYASDHDADLIVTGTHGRRGMHRLLLGSVAEEIVRRADCPVLTVRGQVGEPAQLDDAVSSILVPIDFSEHSREALRYAREIGHLYEAKVNLLHVIEENLHPAFYVGGVSSIYDVEPDIEDKVRARLHTFFEETGGPDVAGVDVYAVAGRAAHEITQFAEHRGADLVVMATHGLTGMEHFFMGSVAEKVVRRVPVPVFTVKSFGKSLLESESPSAEEETS